MLAEGRAIMKRESDEATNSNQCVETRLTESKIESSSLSAHDHTPEGT
jgi:hypothetical protein